MIDDRDLLERALRRFEPDPGLAERVMRRRDRKRRNQRIRAGVAAGAIGIVAVLVGIRVTGDGTGTLPASQPPAVESTVKPAERVAASFLHYYGGAFDANVAMSSLAEDADISGLMLGPERVEGTRGELRLNLAMLEAMGFEQILGPCEETASLPSGTSVRCTFDYYSLGSEEIGPGPSSGTYALRVLDGEIVQASVSWKTGEFSPQMWEPFAEWVYTTYPEDAAVMYTDKTYSEKRVSEESIRLWAMHVREYVGRIAELFMEARGAHDVEKVMSLVADDGVQIREFEVTPEDFGWSGTAAPLDRDELALAFEAERLYGVRYENVECRGDPEIAGPGDVLCTFSTDSRLRRLAGLPPVDSAFMLGLHQGRIAQLSFPLMSARPGGGGPPPELAQFMRWLGRTHPDAGAWMQDGEVFGYDVWGFHTTLNLTPESIDLLERYLDEYERSVTG